MGAASDLTIKEITRSVMLDTSNNKIGESTMTSHMTAVVDGVDTIKRSDFDLLMFAPHVNDEESHVH